MTKEKWILGLGAIFGALAVILGAFGAHALKAQITPDRLEIYQLGVSYQYYHALALLATGVWARLAAAPALKWAGISFAMGILLFSGSLYLLALRDLFGISGSLLAVIGPLTPVGGLFFIGGWSILAIKAFK
ncbi:DUF423 domain-containing protein [Saprospira sp. CCB-QB6]|uniref:DUF423 domain-containing protein n=1 Tax=Saprospira sp. CCB-QB6 TaxID=3023936 RepID=UPI00234BB59F|nr:DUF423 domain-containing protein [Saprospira sp. CCB-QB6]WCL80445.1 DUF423 domain-containing protein [Saprospira sp. CCB-QB6]